MTTTLQQELEKYGDTFAAAAYLCSASLNKEEADREIATMLKKVLEFVYSTNSIVIVNSYIDRAGSSYQRERLIQDAGAGYF